jgi:putative nucleotidyltransferase with HDIG domain
MGSAAAKALLPQVTKALSLPANYEGVIRELESPNGSLSRAAAIISQDPVMSAKVLQVANSAFYGLAEQVTDAVEAIFHLGSEQLKALVLVSSAINRYTPEQLKRFPLEDVWKHSLLVASFARLIADAEGLDRRACETAGTAGLLHDIGKFLFAANIPERYEAVWQVTYIAPRVEERELLLLGTTHAEFGACVLGMWNLPMGVLDAVAWHHAPSSSRDRTPSILTAVHAANVLAHEKGKHSTKSFDEEYLERLGLQEAPKRWRNFLGLPTEG